MAGKSFKHHNLIPDFSLANDFVYFNDLLRINSHNIPISRRKIKLWQAANAAVQSAQTALNSEPDLDTTLQFIQSIAINERQKEIKVIQEYCKKIKINYPNFTTWSEDQIMQNPDAFYIELTNYINEARQQTLQYKDQLERIKKNSGQVAGIARKKSRGDNYSQENYLYRLSSDASSLIKTMIGTFQGNSNSSDAFITKLKNSVMDIMNFQNITKQIASGEDFAAIAVGILADLENRLQAEYEKEIKENSNKLLDQLSDDIIQRITQEYKDELKNGKETTGVQQALQNIHSKDFLRITQNIKNVLGIKQIENPKAAYEQIQKVQQLAENRKMKRNTQNRMINHLRASFSRNKQLVSSLQTLEFTNTNTDTFQGNIAELVQSVIAKNGLQIGGSGSAIDTITLQFNIENKQQENVINEFAGVIGKEIATFAKEATHEQDALSRDLATAVTTMNNNIDNTLKRLDHFLQQENITEPVFIFHESLKLYSSIETGKTSAFTGRTLNILSALDYIYSALSSAGLSFPADISIMRMLALNLSNLAVGGPVKNYLETYLSLFAGLLMFDDITNMALEASEKIQYENVNTVHLYLLNNIYVPSSMILTYIYDNLSIATKMITASQAASVSISTAGADSAIKQWLDNPVTPEPEVWAEKGAAAASGTQVRIAFFAGFLNFIKKL